MNLLQQIQKMKRDICKLENRVGGALLQVNSVDNVSQIKLNLVNSDTVVFEDLGIDGKVTAYTIAELVPPEYLEPTAVISGASPVPSVIEVGTIISPIISLAFNQNDAGNKLTNILNRNGVQIANTFPHTDTNYQIVEGNNSYQAVVTYAQGPIKQDNRGDDYPTGRIEAGSILSNTLMYSGRRKAFYGAITGDVPNSSSTVRGLPNSLLNPSGVDYILNIPIGTVRVVFAIPSTMSISYVEYIELSNSDLKTLFEETVVSVQGANGYLATSYKVYSFTPVEPYPVEVNYRIKVQ